MAEKFPTEGILTSTFKIAAILDKGSGSVYVLDVVSKNKETNEVVVRNQFSIFVVGTGGFNGPRNSDLVVETKVKPDRSPDHSTLYKTSVDQVSNFICDKSGRKKRKKHFIESLVSFSFF